VDGGYMWSWLVVEAKVKVIGGSSYKYRLGPGRV
jgi:hypothetical protein